MMMKSRRLVRMYGIYGGVLFVCLFLVSVSNYRLSLFYFTVQLSTLFFPHKIALIKIC